MEFERPPDLLRKVPPQNESNSEDKYKIEFLKLDDSEPPLLQEKNYKPNTSSQNTVKNALEVSTDLITITFEEITGEKADEISKVKEPIDAIEEKASWGKRIAAGIGYPFVVIGAKLGAFFGSALGSIISTASFIATAPYEEVQKKLESGDKRPDKNTLTPLSKINVWAIKAGDSALKPLNNAAYKLLHYAKTGKKLPQKTIDQKQEEIKTRKHEMKETLKFREKLVKKHKVDFSKIPKAGGHGDIESDVDDFIKGRGRDLGSLIGTPIGLVFGAFVAIGQLFRIPKLVKKIHADKMEQERIIKMFSSEIPMYPKDLEDNETFFVEEEGAAKDLSKILKFGTNELLCAQLAGINEIELADYKLHLSNDSPYLDSQGQLTGEGVESMLVALTKVEPSEIDQYKKRNSNLVENGNLTYEGIGIMLRDLNLKKLQEQKKYQPLINQEKQLIEFIKLFQNANLKSEELFERLKLKKVYAKYLKLSPSQQEKERIHEAQVANDREIQKLNEDDKGKEEKE